MARCNFCKQEATTILGGGEDEFTVMLCSVHYKQYREGNITI